MSECTKAHLQQSRISKNYPEEKPQPRLSREEAREGGNGGREWGKGKGRDWRKGEERGRRGRGGEGSAPPNKYLPLHHFLRRQNKLNLIIHVFF